MFAAVLDTCVLWTSLQRGAILNELRRHEERKLAKRGTDSDEAIRRADHLIEQMRLNFDDALVTGWEGLEGTFGLPDPNDEHVVAAAVVGGAGAIVTENLSDIRHGLVPAHIQVLSVQEFAQTPPTSTPSGPREPCANCRPGIAGRHEALNSC